MIARLAATCVASLLLLCVVAGTAAVPISAVASVPEAPAGLVSAAVPTGPRLAVVEWRPRPAMSRLLTVAPDGSRKRTVPLSGVQPVPYDAPAWVPSGAELVFAGFPVDASGNAREGARTRLYAVAADGAGLRQISGTLGARRPVLSPDGVTVAFTRTRLGYRYDPGRPLDFGLYSSSTIWVAPLAGGDAVRVTPWQRRTLAEPASFSPDGATLLAERRRGDRRPPEVIALGLGGGGARVIATAADAPAFSPDGSWIALVRYPQRRVIAPPGAVSGDLYVMRHDGVSQRRLTRTPTVHESQPAWSADGARLAFLRAPGTGGTGDGTRLFQVNADGACARRVLGSAGARAPLLAGPAWQPGSGRTPAPLSC